MRIPRRNIELPSDYGPSQLPWELQDFDIAALEQEVANYLDEVIHYKTHLENNNIDYFEITYEDLYDQKTTIDGKMDLVASLISYLGYNRTRDEKINEKIRWVLEPRNTKLNSFNSYRRIPNINEIEATLGSEQIGFLFNDPIVWLW